MFEMIERVSCRFHGSVGFACFVSIQEQFAEWFSNSQSLGSLLPEKANVPIVESFIWETFSATKANLGAPYAGMLGWKAN